MKQPKRFNTHKKLIAGLMSGTSADGVDAVLIELRGNGSTTKFKQLSFKTYPYPRGFKQFLLKNSNPATARLDEITRLNVLIGMFFADAAGKITRSAGYSLDNVYLIGSHGQTIQHLPQTVQMFGKSVLATLQIGDPSVIAKLTGVPTVGDFRLGDIAVGGSGAPLVPYMDYIVFRSQSKNRALLNIGGIANITFLPKSCGVDDVLAFDTGPGNMLIDALMKKFYHKEFDKNGATAFKGRILEDLMADLVGTPYLMEKPPKSTGRELFGETLVGKIMRKYRGARKVDIISTVTEFTALSIYMGYKKFISKRAKLDELLVSGGGVHNAYLMEALSSYFVNTKVMPLDDLGFSSDAKEAICFAILANEAIEGNPANITGATGAKRRTILGKICPP
jgi:anhydro-N-acetylmuramic acid kinase